MNTKMTVIWQQAIQQYQEKIATQAEADLGSKMEPLKKNGMKASQFSNLLNMTQEAGNSPTAIRAWVQYQMARKDHMRTWGDTGLGEVIIKYIGDSEGWAKQIVQNNNPAAKNSEVNWVHVRLIALYAGYLRRWFIAKGGREK